MSLDTTQFWQELIMWVLAASMAFVTSMLLKWAVRSNKNRSPVGASFILFILIMMLTMVISAVIYFQSPSTSLLLNLILINMLVMGGGLLPFFLFMSLKLPAEPVSTEIGQSDGSRQTVSANGFRSHRGLIISLVIALVMLNEFFMGWALVLASGSSATSLTIASPLSLLSSVINSYWFIFTMAGEMALTTFFLREEINRTFAYVIGFQSLLMVLSPTAINDPNWVALSVIAGSALMIVLFIFVFEYMSRKTAIGENFSWYILRLLGVYSLMMAGLFLWKVYDSGLLFSLSIVFEMLIYFDLVLNRDHREAAAEKSWLLDAKWTLAILTTIFISEFFMGGLLDVQIYGRETFLQSLALAPIAGNTLAAIGALMYDFVVWFGTITGSVWFLVMMGIEMGALVAFKIRIARELETKIRLGMVILAYAIYAVLLPYFLIPIATLPKVPFIAWSMGVGTAGPVAPAFLVAIIVTYVASGVLSFLFGGRQMCSLFCTAALMYQGTFYDKMKTFNRTSKTAKKFLTTRLSNLYRIIFSVVWASVFAAVAISYLNSIGVLNLSVFGSDPIEFLYLFYFDFLWYIAFITIPFVGTYACVSMGWCHWGTFNQLVGRLGFFKLEVKSADTCAKCPTKDCALACPVGLTNLPSEFISKGQLKSHKCIGVGDCVSSCPYENIKFHDIRHWAKGKMGKRVAREELIQLKGMTPSTNPRNQSKGSKE